MNDELADDLEGLARMSPSVLGRGKQTNKHGTVAQIAV
jgi:hypothetical protein